MSRQRRTFEGQNIASKPNPEFVVSEPYGLLDFLLLKLPDKSRNHVKSLLTHGEVLVNGAVVTQYDTVLQPGQKIEIDRSAPEGKKQKCALDILYEDSDMIVINKPAGLLTIASDQERELTAYHMLTDYVRTKDPRNRIFVVHRLDRDTSGVLIFAKNERMKLALQDNWADLVSERRYAAVVEGQLEEKRGRIRSWLKDTKTFLVYSSQRAGDGLEAITDYHVINETAGYSLLDIALKTGRKNQIRVHMKDIGHNVAGDKKYGAKTDPLKRLCLHAYKLELKHPFSDEVMCFETPFPESFTSLFARAGSNNMQNG